MFTIAKSLTMMSVGADTTLLQLQQEVVDRVNLPVLIPAMNTERLLTPQQNSDLCNDLFSSQKRCMGTHNLHLW